MPNPSIEQLQEIDTYFQQWTKDFVNQSSEKQYKELINKYHELLIARAITFEEISGLITYIEVNTINVNSQVLTSILLITLKKISSDKQLNQKWDSLFLTMLNAIECIIIDQGCTPDVKYMIKFFAVLTMFMNREKVANAFLDLIDSKKISSLVKEHYDLKLSLAFIAEATRHTYGKIPSRQAVDQEDQKVVLKRNFQNANDFSLEKKTKITAQSIFEILDILNMCSYPNLYKLRLYFLDTYVAHFYEDKYKHTVFKCFNVLCSELKELSFDGQWILLIELSLCVSQLYEKKDIALLELQELIIDTVNTLHESVLQADTTWETHERYLNLHRKLLKQGIKIYKYHSASFIFFKHIEGFLSLCFKPYNEEKQTFFNSAPAIKIDIYSKSLAKLCEHFSAEKEPKKMMVRFIRLWIQKLCEAERFECATYFFDTIKTSLPTQNRKQIYSLIH